MALLPSAKRLRSLVETAQSLTREGGDRYVDLAVTLHAVEQDHAHGASPGRGLPPVVEVGEPITIGGRFDTVSGTFAGEPRSSRHWMVGRKQLDILLEEDESKTRTLLYAAEGAGKTVLMAQAVVLSHIRLALAGEPGAMGCTAPTEKRLDTFVRAVLDLVPTDRARESKPGAWGTYYVDRKDLVMVTGHTIQFRSTQRQSAASGAPLQGYTWKCAFADEFQDQVEQRAYPDIEARLRGAKTSRIVATATAKDSPGWRNFRDSLSSDWRVERIAYTDTPFVHPEHWERMQRNVSEREWKRRGLAMDVGPERMVYTTWQRSENLRPVPSIGAKDVTRRLLSRYGPNYEVLVGHDPGQLQDVSVLLKAYEIAGKVCWFVVGEVTTNQSTTEEHAGALRRVLQEQFGVQYAAHDEPKALIRCDPYGDNDQRTDRSVYLTLKQQGFAIMSAAYRKGKGNGRVPKEAGIEMVCSLLCNARGERRLFVATDDRGRPVAPKLVEALELSERDEAGKAETQRKNSQDMSHWPSALRYALWAIERVRDQDGVRTGVALG